MKYNHEEQYVRQALATGILAQLEGKQFQQTLEGGEIVLRRQFPSGKVLKVYTSAHLVNGNPEVAQVGQDAIRFVVEAPTKTGFRAVFPTQKRVNRVGKVDDIIGRTMMATKTLFEEAGKLGYCSRCQGFLGISKKGNQYCLNLCFAK